MTPNNRILHHVVAAPGRALPLVTGLLAGDENRTRKLFELGALYLNKVRLRDDRELVPGDYLRIHREPRRYALKSNLRERVRLESPEFLILDKPSGVPCHATVDNGVENLLEWWKRETGETIFITHRLDVPTSGCLVLARTPEAASRFNRLLLKNGVRKEYDAIVQGELAREGLVTHWMLDENWAPRHVFPEPFDGALECRLNIRRREPFARDGVRGTRARLLLETGRTHQIRVQMAALGHPVLNDVMYGADRLAEGERITLRAVEIEFRDPFSGAVFHVHAQDDVQSAVFETVL